MLGTEDALDDLGIEIDLEALVADEDEDEDPVVESDDLDAVSADEE